MPWFIKRESILVPPGELRDTISAHRQWVQQLRQRGIRISSGYLVDGQGQPGGGGLLLLEASDYQSAAALIAADPMLQSGKVSWQLHQWLSSSGDLATDQAPGDPPT